MSVTQYIGARYVPLFATPEQWSSERAYEPLTIVLHEGNSYTSKQAVPIGIDIQNNEFWALTGNYNAQVEAYRQEVAQFADDIEAAQQTADEAKEAVTTEAAAREATDTSLQEAIEAEAAARETADTGLQEAIEAEAAARETADTGLQGSIEAEAAARQAEDAAINSRIDSITLKRTDEFKNAVSLCFGDSNAWGQMEYLSQNWYRRICNKLGCTYNNFGVSSACWQDNIPVGPVTNSFKQQIQAESSVNPDDVKIVFIMGGINDFHYAPLNLNNFGSAVAQTVNAALTKYKNALVVIMFDSGRQLPTHKLLAYEQALTLYGTSWHTRCLTVPLADLCTDLSLWENQNHYNDSGCAAVASRIYTALMGGTYTKYNSRYIGNVYTEENPDENGNYGLVTYTNTTIDPINITRHDEQGVHFQTTFNNVTPKTEYSNVDILALLDGVFPRGDYNNSTFVAHPYIFSGSQWSSLSVNSVPMRMRQHYLGEVDRDPKISICTRFKTPAEQILGKEFFFDFDYTSSANWY